ncbi:MAG TPA: hypothetical protein GX506_00110 [Firmicutes bacterium]|nr:hypothetical protein [Bacillota bacterium]
MVALALVAAIGFLIFSIMERTRQKRERWAEVTPSEPRSSPLSEAIVEFVGVSGGIYLALIMLINFLQLNIPEKIALWGVEFDPVAALSMLFGAIQPFALRLWKKLET